MSFIVCMHVRIWQASQATCTCYVQEDPTLCLSHTHPCPEYRVLRCILRALALDLCACCTYTYVFIHASHTHTETHADNDLERFEIVASQILMLPNSSHCLLVKNQK
jgi:hypothetical protein